MPRTAKPVLTLPRSVVREVETLAKAERRTAGAMVREMVRVYRRERQAQEPYGPGWAGRIIAEAKAEEARAPITPEAFRAQLAEAARYGQRQARKLGITTDRDIERAIHEYRRSRKASGRP